MPKMNLFTAFAAVWLTGLTAAALAMPWLSLRDPFENDLLAMLSSPSLEHWFGTDSLGRDLFARCVLGARVSLTVGLGSVAFGLLVGGTLGLVAGYFRDTWDRPVMGIMTVLLSFPPLVLAIAIVSSLGPDLRNVVVAIGVLFVPAFARISRANTMSFREREFVLAAEAMGASTSRILFREILPNVVPSLLSYSIVMLGVAILAEASLGFLGLSVPPPIPSWGGIISMEKASLREAPLSVFLPALVMFLTVTSVNILGEATRRLFDVRAQGI